MGQRAEGRTVEKDVEKMRISFLGAGAWGTTMGIMLHEAGHDIRLWEINRERVQKLGFTHRLPGVLPGVRIPEKLLYTSEIREAVEGADLLALAVPCQALRATLRLLVKNYEPPHHVVSLIKGLEVKTGARPTEVWLERFPESEPCVVSGPSIALEVLQGQPTALVAAGRNAKSVEAAQKIFSFKNLRVYRSEDPVGVELGGALKNVIAIGCGIAEGLGSGTNTRAALISRGLAEVTRLGEKMGANARTFAGLAGWGDLVTTVWNPFSRNHRVGLALAQGKALEAILEELGMVAEGVETCRVALKLGKKYGVEMPITEAVYKVLFRQASPESQLKTLLSRPLKHEVW